MVVFKFTVHIIFRVSSSSHIRGKHTSVLQNYWYLSFFLKSTLYKESTTSDSKEWVVSLSERFLQYGRSVEPGLKKRWHESSQDWHILSETVVIVPTKQGVYTMVLSRPTAGRNDRVLGTTEKCVEKEWRLDNVYWKFQIESLSLE